MGLYLSFSFYLSSFLWFVLFRMSRQCVTNTINIWKLISLGIKFNNNLITEYYFLWTRMLFGPKFTIPITHKFCHLKFIWPSYKITLNFRWHWPLNKLQWNNYVKNQFSLIWPWHWICLNDLGTHSWPRYCKILKLMKFPALAVQKLSPEQIRRHIDSQIDTQQSTCEDGLGFCGKHEHY